MTHNPNRRYTIAFDVGGHYVKSAVLDEDDRIIPETYAVYPANSKQSKAELISHFASLIALQAGKIQGGAIRLAGVGYAFPGPFDYAEGISYIRGIDKFEHLYGVNLGRELTAALRQDKAVEPMLADGFRIVFENDARLFALGELHAGKARAYNRSMVLTIGTGSGSAFLDGGRLVIARHDVPADGWVFKEPFGESIVDDYVSKRGIMRLAGAMGVRTDGRDVEDLAELALGGDCRAIDVFQTFGRMVGDALSPFIERFAPDALIIGGQIAKSGELFVGEIRSTLGERALAVEIAADTSLSAFVGVARHLRSALC